ncbi:MAG: hypothetical protein ACR2PJ_05675 [Pseudomonadales bacterium]
MSLHSGCLQLRQWPEVYTDEWQMSQIHAGYLPWLNREDAHGLELAQ